MISTTIADAMAGGSVRLGLEKIQPPEAKQADQARQQACGADTSSAAHAAEG